MKVRAKRDRDRFCSRPIVKLSIVSMIVALSSAMIDSVWAIYLDSFIHSEVGVGIISAILTLISFGSYFIFIPLIQTSNKSNLFLNSLVLFSSTYMLFALISDFFIFLLLAITVTLLYVLRMTSFGIIVRDASSERDLVKNEGLIYTFFNIAWVLGPLLAGFLLAKFGNTEGITFVFVSASVFILLAFFVFKISNIKNKNVLKKPDKKVLNNFISFFKQRDRVFAYALGGGVHLWFCFLYIFVPLHMVRSGLPEAYVGYFLFAAAIPWILFEYYFSKRAFEIGFKKIFKIGFLIIAFCSLACFFLTNIYIILGILILASMGIAMVEPVAEAYFFDVLRTKKEELRFYNPYSTTVDSAHFLGRVSSTIILFFLPFRFLFLLFAGFMLGLFLLSSNIKNVIESRKDGRENIE
jgi:MFS family permease